MPAFRKTTTVTIFLKAVLLCVLLYSPALALGPYEVRVYSGQKFQGDHKSFSIYAGMRHRLVPQLGLAGNRVGTVMVGSKVAVAIYSGSHFQYNEIIYRQSRSDLRHRAGSLIVFHRSLAYPRGARLEGWFAEKMSFWRATMLPLPESIKQKAVCFGNVGYNGSAWTTAWSLRSSGPWTRAYLYTLRHCQGNPALNFYGGGKHRQFKVNLKTGKYAWINRRVLSVKVMYDYRPPKARPLPGPGRPAPKVAGAVTKVARVAGIWKSNLGVVYTITQKGAQFWWSAPVLKQKAGGAIKGYRVQATWTEMGQKKSVSGIISRMTAGRQAQQIKWSNGVIFNRVVQVGGAVKPGLSRMVSLAGTWKSSIGLVYQFQQKGSQFSWFISAINQKGTGTIKGKALKATFSGPTGSGQAQGQVSKVDHNQRALEIRWKSGVVLFR